MRVFVFEHVCGGGMLRQPLDASLVTRGMAMLKVVVEDFLQAGAQVMTTLDWRIELPLHGAQVLKSEADSNVEGVIDQLAAEADWALVIAPEFDKILETWSSKLTAAGARRLGSRPDAIALCADKLTFAQTLREGTRGGGKAGWGGGAAVPETWRLRADEVVDQPLVVKRRRGSGCEEVYIVRGKDDLARLPYGRDWVAQLYVPGMAVSVPFIVHGSKRRRLRACEQIVEGQWKVAYRGGRMPLRADLVERAYGLAEDVIGRIAGLRGFVEADLILAENPDDDVVLEVNARPTLSYLGLRQLCTKSVAMALVDEHAPLAWREERLRFAVDGRVEPETMPVAGSIAL
ncbi:MAG: ATP-grasp domain-containing protein [Phycisphaeraceae bacterium]|nr:ATP-grasp domain-containing protein [Phycisphaeraceae bacterium]